MGLLILLIAIILACSFLLARVVYKRQVKNKSESPMVIAVIVFILTAAVLAAGIFLLILSNLNFSRR